MSTFKIDQALTQAGVPRGAWVRPRSKFRDWMSSDGSTAYPAEPGRYHLYIAWACPWAHRTMIGRRLKGLEDVIDVSFVDPIRDERGWAFTGGQYVDRLHGWRYLSEAYDATEADYEGRFSTPVLWDEHSGRIVNNESADILRMMSTGFGELASNDVELVPHEDLDEINALNKRTYETLNNAVYRAGFASEQGLYEEIVHELFATLDELDQRLADRRYLFGEKPVETDWRLFTTLVRFDAIYYIHFKCSLKRIADYPNLWPYVRDLYQEHGIADTVRPEEYRPHYYRTQSSINPRGVVAVAPAVVDFTRPHNRGSLARR
jgi:putative glutathione S-transferase